MLMTYFYSNFKIRNYMLLHIVKYYKVSSSIICACLLGPSMGHSDRAYQVSKSGISLTTAGVIQSPTNL